MLYSLVYSKSASNVGGYSNPQVDERIERAARQFNKTTRERGLRFANELAMNDLAIIPLFYINRIWAIRSDMVFTPTDVRFTEAYYVRPLGVKK